MIYALFIGILILFFLSFFLFYKNILNPSTVLCSVFLLSLFFSILNIKRWNIDISLKTAGIVIGSIITFIIGNSIVLLFPYKKKNNIYFYKIKKISFKKIILISILLVIFLVQYFKATYQLSLIAGNTEGYSMMIKYARIARLNFYTVGSMNTLKFYFAMAIAYITLFTYMYITIFEKFSFKNTYLLLPTIIYLNFCILSTGRTAIIYLFVYIIIIFGVLYQRKNNFSKKATKKILVYIFIILVCFLVFFIILGLLVRKQNKTVFDFLSVYIGSPIPAFDKYLKLGIVTENKYFGERTLFKLYNIFRNLGFEILKFYAPYERIKLTPEMFPNIYGAIRRYYDDFSFVGLLVIIYLLGMFYGIFFHFICYRNKTIFGLILYANFAYPIFEFPIEERFFMELFPTGFMRDFIFIGGIYYILLKKNIKYINRKGEK